MSVHYQVVIGNRQRGLIVKFKFTHALKNDISDADFFRSEGMLDLDVSTPEWQSVFQKLKVSSKSVKKPQCHFEESREAAIKTLESKLGKHRSKIKLISDIHVVGPTPFIIGKIMNANQPD